MLIGLRSDLEHDRHTPGHPDENTSVWFQGPVQAAQVDLKSSKKPHQTGHLDLQQQALLSCFGNSCIDAISNCNCSSVHCLAALKIRQLSETAPDSLPIV